MKDMGEDTIEKIRNSLEKEGVSYKTLIDVVSSFEMMKRDLVRLGSQLAWLENRIDESDMEELYVEYQKHFKIRYWSGDPS